MELVLGTLTYNRLEDCNKLLRSVYTGTYIPKACIVLDNSAGKFKPDQDVDSDNLHIFVPPNNIGVARGFNFLMHVVKEEFPGAMCVISNDDLVLYPDTLENLVKGIKKDPDKLIYCSDLHSANSFSFFCVDPTKVIETVGWFEIDYHSYAEDTDFMHRARMLGYELFPVEGVSIKEHVGSGTLAAFTPDEEARFHQRRARGIEIYRSKWGGTPESGEVYTTPYNSGMDAVTWHRQKFTTVNPF